MDAFDSRINFTRIEFVIFCGSSHASGVVHAAEVYALASKQPEPLSVNQFRSPLTASQPRYGAATQAWNEACKLVVAR
jgi:hypothetical protein